MLGSRVFKFPDDFLSPKNGHSSNELHTSNELELGYFITIFIGESDMTKRYSLVISDSDANAKEDEVNELIIKRLNVRLVSKLRCMLIIESVSSCVDAQTFWPEKLPSRP